MTQSHLFITSEMSNSEDVFIESSERCVKMIQLKKDNISLQKLFSDIE
jgi:hypothetical protein